jgi:glycosyltransferase involved in cell wall biosynthesis
MMFSVILCTFNRGYIIERAIKSVIEQTFDDWELIIVDDGSNDNTKEIVLPYLSDKRISYHYEANKGQALARNFGCSLATGRYFTFLDSDDEYLLDHLDSRFDILSSKPALELLHGGIEVIGSPYVADKYNPSAQIHLSECAVGGTFFIRRDLWSRLGGYNDVLYGDDTEFFEKAVARGTTILKTDIPTYRYYRTGEDSLCNIVEAKGFEGIEEYRSLVR